MVPAYYIRIDNIPLNTSGKLDRKALPDPKDRLKVETVYSEPTNETEEKIAEIWKEVLGVKKVGVDDNFFELGGHSLKATTIMSNVNHEFNVEISLGEIFKALTVRNLAKIVSSHKESIQFTLQPLQEKEYYPLSSAQKRQYVLNNVEGIDVSYNIPFAIIIRGRLDKEKLENVVHKIIKRHEVLRTSFVLVNGEPVQKIQKDIDFNISYAEVEESSIREYFDSFIQPFELSQAPLFRIGVFRLSDEKHVLMFDMHHIISDGTSMNILVREFASMYEGKKLQPLKVQYKNFSEWQNGLKQTAVMKKQEDYWLQVYKKPVPILNMPTDYSRPPIQSFEGDEVSFRICSKIVEELHKVSIDSGTTLFMILLAAYNILLYKYTGQEDIVVGTPIAGRKHKDFENVMGMFVNTLAIRSFPCGNMSFMEFLSNVKNNTLDAYENQDYQFEELVDKLDLQRDLSRNPLFDTMFVLQNMGKQEIKINSLNILPFEHERKVSLFDIRLEAIEEEESIKCNLEYCKKLYSRESMERFSKYYVNILKSIVANKDIKICDIDITDEIEKQQVITEFNRTTADYPKDKTLHEIFEEQVRKTPDSIAVMFEEKKLTYREVDEKANKLANYLIKEHKIKPDNLVGVFMDRSEKMIVSIIGILKAGGAYVPIGTSYPIERIKSIIDSAGIRVVITTKKYWSILNRLQWECKSFDAYLCIDETDSYLHNHINENQLSSEKELWNYVSRNNEDEFDEISGAAWVSSYTGTEFSKQEMKEYSDNTFEKLKPYINSNVKVLEIGCASGITMYKIAPLVKLFYGTDLSEEMIKNNQKKVIDNNINNIKLECLAAHEIDKIKDQDFDIIILNSVVQYFSDYRYLTEVIEKAITMLGESGIIYIGDIRDQDLKSQFIQSLVDYMNNNSDNNYKIRTNYTDELFLPRRYFEDLRKSNAYISDIVCSNKIFTIENELTKYRYDAVINVSKTKLNQTLTVQSQKKQHGVSYLDNYSNIAPITNVKSNNLVYVIFTSGSTGEPKGVMIEHRSVVNRLTWMQSKYPINNGDVVMQKTPITFDVSVWELFWWFFNGAAVNLLVPDGEKDPEKIIQSIEEYGITTLHFVPSMLTAFLEFVEDQKCQAKIKNLRQVFASGEALGTYQVERFNRLIHAPNGTTLHNLYGPTEATVDVSYYDCFPYKETDVIPIGKPINNIRLYILDEHRKPQPIGFAGELAIAGDGLARGYLNNEVLTKEKFEQVSFKDKNNSVYLIERLYMTGDLARWKYNGEIEFLGRIDYQAKIRGFRIELGEIESRLLEYPGISEAVVLDRKDKKNDKYLCAYIVSKRVVNDKELKDHLMRFLPEYMVPSFYVYLDKMPLTTSGKVDRKVLPQPIRGEHNLEGYVAPRDKTEKELSKIWSDLLDIDRIGVFDNFFEMGGHSLKATILISRINKSLDVKLSLTEIFQNPTIAGIAQIIKSNSKSYYIPINHVNEEYSLNGCYPVSSAQKRLLIVDKLQNMGVSYNMPAAMMIEGEFEIDRLQSACDQLIERHESLRTSFEWFADEPLQRIHSNINCKIECSQIEENQIEQAIRSFIKPFDLNSTPLFRVGLLKISTQKHILIFDMHHIVSDGTSIGIIIKEFISLYQGNRLQRQNIQYKDFAVWQNQLFQSDTMKQQETYWMNQLKGEIPVLNLVTDYERAEIQNLTGAIISLDLGEELSAGLKKFAIETDTTLYMVMLAAYNVLLSKYTGQEDIFVASPIAGRNHPDLENVVGMFVNTLVMRNHPYKYKTFLEFLNEVKKNSLDAYENQDYQFEKLVECLNVKRKSGRAQIYDVMFIFQNMNMPDVEINNLKFTPIDTFSGEVKCDVTLSVGEKDGIISGSVTYSSKLFKEATIMRMIKDYKKILLKVVECRNIYIRDIGIESNVTVPEKEIIDVDFNF